MSLKIQVNTDTIPDTPSLKIETAESEKFHLILNPVPLANQKTI